jgi:prepilin-type N-terminal cleavage/methylation domain-containing protein
VSLGPGRRSEAGTTLIELLVALAIMGIAFVTVIGGIGTAIIGAGTQKQQASTTVVLRTAAEALTWQPCATPATYQGAAAPPPAAGFTISVTKVQQWDRAANVFTADPACTPATDAGLELIELTVASTRRPVVTQTLQVVKAQP